MRLVAAAEEAAEKDAEVQVVVAQAEVLLTMVKEVLLEVVALEEAKETEIIKDKMVQIQEEINLVAVEALVVLLALIVLLMVVVTALEKAEVEVVQVPLQTLNNLKDQIVQVHQVMMTLYLQH